MTFEPFAYLSLHHFCHATPAPGNLQLPGNRIYTDLGSGGGEPFSRPRVHTTEDGPHLGKFLGGGTRVDPDLAFTTSGGRLGVAQRFIAALDDVSVQRVNQGRERYLLRLAPGIVAAETYHTEAVGRHLSKAWGETRADGSNWMDASPPAPPPWIEERPVVMLASMWGDNYAHWLLEVLPRLWYRDACPELADLRIVLGRQGNDFQEETLRALNAYRPGINHNDPATHYQRLYFPSFIAPGGYSRHQVEWLNTKLRVAFDLPPATLDPAVRLYVSRADASHRRVMNEDAVLQALRTQGYCPITPGEMSVKDQVIAFSAASEIVIPHGAAGANLVFAPPDCKVLELVPSSYRHPMYWWLSQFRGLDYARLPCADTEREKDMTVDVDKMLKMMEGLRS